MVEVIRHWELVGKMDSDPLGGLGVNPDFSGTVGFISFPEKGAINSSWHFWSEFLSIASKVDSKIKFHKYAMEMHQWLFIQVVSGLN